MIALSKSESTVSTYQPLFLKMLPAIRKHARFAFRHLGAEAREEAVQEVVARAWAEFAGLVEEGRVHLAFPTPLARYAVAQLRDGRKVGSKRNVGEVLSRYCQRQKDVSVESIHRWDQQDEEWRELLLEDKRATPAALAASRIDFAEWLSTLSARHRRIALTLARGESTAAAARMFGLSPGRISQLRQEFKSRWCEFQGEEPADGASEKLAG